MVVIVSVVASSISISFLLVSSVRASLADRSFLRERFRLQLFATVFASALDLFAILVAFSCRPIVTYSCSSYARVAESESLYFLQNSVAWK